MPDASETSWAIDRAGQALARELVDPALPVDLGDLAGDSGRRTRGAPCTASGGASPRSSCRSTACRCRGAGRCGLARRRRAIARRARRTSDRGPRARPGGRRPCAAAASQTSTSPRSLRRLAPDRLARVTGVPAPAAPGRLAAAPRVRVRDRPGTTSSGRRRRPGIRVLPPVRHDPSSGEPRKARPGGQAGDRIVRNGGVRWGSLGSDGPNEIPRETPAQSAENGQRQRMPEEGLEPPTRGL